MGDPNRMQQSAAAAFEYPRPLPEYVSILIVFSCCSLLGNGVAVYIYLDVFLGRPQSKKPPPVL